MNKYKIYTTYALVPTGDTAGYTRAIHCNYINSLELETNNIAIQELKINFESADDFKFLSDNIALGTGFSVHRIYTVFQIVEILDNVVTKPDPANWKYFDITNQVSGYTGSGFLTANQLKSVVFKIPFNNYDIYPTYNLNYLNYPSDTQIDQLCFGDETYFLGNVDTEIKADVYTLDLSIGLGLNEFNSSNNLTWDGLSTVYITEIGIYDTNKNLVAIGKLNNPVPKNSTISRTIVFAIDF